MTSSLPPQLQSDSCFMELALCSPLYSEGHTQGTEQGCSHRPSVNRDSTYGLKSSLEATLKGRIAIQRRPAMMMQFPYSHVLNFTIVIQHIVWNKTQALYSLLETNAEVFKGNPGFPGNWNLFWCYFILWFRPCLALHIRISFFWHLFCI